MGTKIEWVKNKDGSKGETWNVITGCTPISEGCKKCYAFRMSKRLAGRFGYPKDEPFKVTLHPDRLIQPFKWKKPKRIFAVSMGDLFHDDVPFEFQTKVFDCAKQASWKRGHTFIFLTKRPQNMKEFFNRWLNDNDMPDKFWVGVTAENQEMADYRIPILLQIPSAVRFVSCEPLLEHINLNLSEHIHQIIVGSETGMGKRLMDLDWARSIREQCKILEVPFFFKKASDSSHELDGEIWEEMPK